MVVTSRGYMRTRDLEAVMGVLMLVSGVVFAMPGETLANPVFAQMRSWIPRWLPEELGGLFLALIAMTRFWGLYRNSHMTRSPLLRLAGCAVGAAFWVTMSVSITKAVLVMPALPMLLGVVLVLAGAEFYSAIRTGFDADALDSLGFRERAFLRRERQRRAGTSLDATL